MKKFITILTLLVGFNANAGLLTIDLSADDVSVGDSVLVTINATDFDDTDFFLFDFNFDTSFVSFDDASLISDLADGSIGDFNGLTVAKENYGLYFEFATDDSAWAAGDFVLASFNLIAGSEGFTEFSISEFFNPSAFDDYEVTFSGSNSVNVNSNSIPEPTSAALLLLAGFAFASSRKTK